MKRDATRCCGQPINITEGRAVLHTALREPREATLIVEGEDIVPGIHRVLDAMAWPRPFERAGRIARRQDDHRCRQHRHRRIRSRSGHGDARATPYHDGPRSHFVSNVDGAHIADTLKGLDPETTLFIVASKTFTTIETMTNAETRKTMDRGCAGDEAVANHFVAVSTRSTRSAASASRRTACSNSGIGSAAAIRSGRPSACRS